MNDLLDADRNNIWHPFTPLIGAPDPLLISSADGVYLYTNEGNQIIDAISSWWVNIHGHSNPQIAEAIYTQAKTLEHVIFAGFTHKPAIQLSKNLLSILPNNIKKIFFSDDGSTAVEVALKIAIQYWANTGINKSEIIAIAGAYHGDTFGSMSVGDRSIFTDPFRNHLFNTHYIDFPSDESEQKVIEHFTELVKTGTCAAFIFEPLVQGASGMRMYSATVLESLMRIAQEHDVICIADEVFTGFGRTGNIFASNFITVKPDLIALSKGITGGVMPLGVTACSDKIISAFDSAESTKTFFHGHSFTANPLACAAANASFNLLVSDTCQKNIQRVSHEHKLFIESVKTHKMVKHARCLGTIAAIEVNSEEKTSYTNNLRKKIYDYFLSKGILLRPLGNVIYIVPPYIISNEQLHEIYMAIKDFLEMLSQEKE